MVQKSSKTTKIFALIFMCLLLASCGKPKPLTMKSDADIDRALRNSFYTINTKDMKYYTSKDLIDHAESGVYPSVSVLEDYSTSSVIFQHAGEDLVFVKKIIVKTDKHKYKLDFEEAQVDRNEFKYSADVTERVLFNVDRKKYDMLVDMANSDNTSVMFSGAESQSFELTDKNKKVIKSFLSCFKEE